MANEANLKIQKIIIMEYNPLVSIIIPVYKGDPYLREAIESCLNQTYRNIEIIVVNDGSPDNGKTRKIVQSYGDKIRYFEKENGGVSTALNYGIAKMKGEWFSWLSHDDLYLPDKIKHQIEAVRELENKVCVVRCSTCSINESGEPIFRPQRKVRGVYSGQQMLKMHSLNEVGLYGCTLLINKAILNHIGDFSLDLKTIQDEEYWTKIMLEGYTFVSIPETLVKIRIHSGQTTNLLSDRFEIERKVFVKRMISLYRTNPQKYFNGLMILLYKQVQSQRKEEAKMLKDELKADLQFTPAHHISCFFYNMYGMCYCLLKKAYRIIVIKKHRQ